MRRALMTMRPLGGGPPFTMGSPAAAGSADWSAGYLTINPANPAPRAGTVTSVSAYGASTPSGGSLYVVTGTLSGTTFTVNQVSPALAWAGGVNTSSVSLAIGSGQVIGLWLTSGGRATRYTSGAGTMWYASLASAPTAGQVVSGMTSFTGTLSLEGTGS